MNNPKAAWLAQVPSDVSKLDEVLQKVDDPVAELLKQVSTKVAVVVPYEYAWPDNLQPFKNKEHKRFYDADLLAEHLEKAGYRQYTMRLIEFGGWSFLAAECVKLLNSKERRRLKRGNDMRLRNREAVAQVVSGEGGHDGGTGQAGHSEIGDEEPLTSGRDDKV